MCGHVTIFSPEHVVSREHLHRATQILTHRGPDAQRVWISDDGKVGMGHARLSIIDLQTGDQPLHTVDDTLHAVVNGEFYGYEAIRKSLQERGCQLRSQSDSEILLHLYRERGTDCLRDLRGEFALTLWDAANQVLFAARDRFGIKPLYYSQVGSTLYLASEAKALFAAGVPAVWDDDTVYNMHTAMLPPLSRSYFKSVYQVPPGHFMLVHDGRVQIIRYWDFNYPTLTDDAARSMSEMDCIEETRAALHDAVKVRLRADVPVGCYLSGGLDSCSLLGIASQYATRPLHAFTVAFEQPGQQEYNEATLAREMAQHVGAFYTPVSVTPQLLTDHFAQSLWHTENPMVNLHGTAKFLLSAAARQAGYKVVLTGEGADEIFAGYASFRKDAFLHHHDACDPAEKVKMLANLRASNTLSAGLLIAEDRQAVASVTQTLGYMPAFLEPFAQQGERMRALLDAKLSHRLGPRDPYRLLLNEVDVGGQMAHRDPVHQSLYLWSKTMLQHYLLTTLGDRMEMAHSLEGRLPMLDHYLVEKVVKMPMRMKIKGTVEKYLLREAAKPVLTDTVYKRQKHPFLAPPVARAATGPFHTLVQDTLRGSQLDRVSFYDKRAVRRMLDVFIQGDAEQRAALDTPMMMVLSITLMQERFRLSA